MKQLTDKKVAKAFMALYCAKGHECEDPECVCPYLNILRAHIDAQDAESRASAEEFDLAMELLAEARSLFRQAVYPGETWSRSLVKEFKDRVAAWDHQASEFLQDGAKR